MKSLVLYHGHCRDGQVAAWCAKRHYGDEAIYVPCFYGTTPQEAYTGKYKDIVIVDFCFSRETLTWMAENCERLTVLDHHVTARDMLTNWPDQPKNVKTVFNMEASGAYLSWFHFAEPEDSCPWVVSYTQDHDLWQFKLSGSRAIRAWMHLFPLDDLAVPGVIEHLLDTAFGEALNTGDALINATKIRTKRVADTSIHIDIGYNARIANSSTDISEAGQAILEAFPECEVSITYYDDLPSGKTRYSLRSRKGGVDVSKIAKALGGGGHPNAAGFEDTSTNFHYLADSWRETIKAAK